MPQSLNGRIVSAACRSCGSPIAQDEPILEKFQRCYYCGQRNPLGSKWTLATMPAVLAVMIGALAIWWAQLPS